MAYDELTQILTVSQCNALIKESLDEMFPQIIVKGEISGNTFRTNASGHYYFDLKDSGASLPCAVFRSNTRGLEKFSAGDLVVATGHISIYEKNGKLSFIISRMVREGDGELQALIEKRKLYYQNLGWFDPQNKPSLPESIKKVGVVTSATGAVIHDILDVTRRCAPSLDIILFPSAVQGAGAEETIASRIRQANNFEACDVLIVARGGGSREDLMPYNEDAVIVAIHESRIPVISAVGHESDWSLSDYVATVRAGTPSIAAEIVTKDILKKRNSFASVRSTMNLVMENRIARTRSLIPDTAVIESLMKAKLDKARGIVPSTSAMKMILSNRFQNAQMRLSFGEDSLRISIEDRIREDRRKLEILSSSLELTLPHITESGRRVIEDYRKTASLLLKSSLTYYSEKVKSGKKEIDALSPLSVLSRGFALVTDRNGKVITRAGSVHKDDEIRIRMQDGTLKAAVKETI